MPRQAKAPKAKAEPYRLAKPTALCVGGPWDGWCYYVAELETRRAIWAAQGRPFPYRQTQQHRPHPVVTGEVQVWVHDAPN